MDRSGDKSQTATTHGARDHARSLENETVPGMPTLPASKATELPAGVRPIDVLWDEVLDAGEYAAHRLPRGAILRLADVDGDACAHVAIHHAAMPVERLNLAEYRAFWIRMLDTKVHLRNWRADLAELQRIRPAMKEWNVQLLQSDPPITLANAISRRQERFDNPASGA